MPDRQTDRRTDKTCNSAYQDGGIISSRAVEAGRKWWISGIPVDRIRVICSDHACYRWLCRGGAELSLCVARYSLPAAGVRPSELNIQDDTGQSAIIRRYAIMADGTALLVS